VVSYSSKEAITAYHPLLPTLTCSEYGYKRANRTTCSRDGSFNLASVCPPGTSTYNTSKLGFRLIPGDLCQPNDQSRSLLKVIQQPCTRHELTVGDSKGGGGAVKHFVVSVVAVCLCVCWRGGGCSELYSFYPYITNA